MAQVQQLSKKGLKHEFAIKVPQADVEKRRKTRLEEIGKTASLPGFRKGKYPINVLEMHFGERARAEVLDQVVSEASEQALTENKLRPAQQPQIEIVSIEANKDVEFKLAVEILPEITPTDFSKIAIEKPTAEVSDKAIEDAIGRAAKAMREPEVVTDGRAAQKGDVLVIDFDGSVDGERRPGMKGDGHKLELGSQSFIDTFEDQLIGSKVGDKKMIKVAFPKDYHAAELAGKKAEFAVDVKELRAPKPVEMNDALAKDLGFPSLEKLRERVKDDLGANYANISRAIAKRALMDKLADAHDFEVPAGLLEAEFGSIWKQVEEAKARGEQPKEDKGKSDEALKKEYHGIAERRIRLGLLLAEVARKHKIDVPPDALRTALMAEARRFPGQEKAVIDYYTQTQGALERLRAPLLEEKVIDHILAQTKISEKKVSVEDLVKLGQDDE
jgi:trigger factor